jgi:hypothetical protein
LQPVRCTCGRLIFLTVTPTFTSSWPTTQPNTPQINPAGTVPSLGDASGKVISTSSRGIVELVDGLGDGPLGGKGADRKLVKTWIDKVDA